MSENTGNNDDQRNGDDDDDADGQAAPDVQVNGDDVEVNIDKSEGDSSSDGEATD